MFHRFPFGLVFLVFFCLQVETQGSSSYPPLDQNVVVPSNISQNIPVLFPFDATTATVWRIPLGHQNSTLLLKALWDIQKLRDKHDDDDEYERKGYWRISVQRHEDGLVDVKPARPHEFPYKVYLSRKNNSSFFCGGSIISKWLILTAAHCLHDDELNASSLMVTAGFHGHFSRPSGLEQIRVVVDEVHVHPNYTRGEHDDNIGILVLSEPLAFSSAAVTSIDLPYRGETFSGNITVSGWGSTTASGDPSWDVLNKVTAPILLNSRCNSQYYANTNVRITEQMFCAQEEGQVSCQGDSGGPAVCTVGGWGLQRVSVLCGIVSLREGGCGLVDASPGVYVQVSKYTSWVLGVLKNRTLENPCLLDGGGTTTSNGTDLLTNHCVSNKYLLPDPDEPRPDGVEEEETGFLLLLLTSNNKTSLLRMDLSEAARERIDQVLLPGSALGNNPTSVDFDLENNVLYWVDNNGTDIKRLYVNGNKDVPEALLSLSKNGSGMIRGLAFDWMSRNLYFTDSERGTIEVIRTDDGLPSSAIHARIMRKQLLTRPDVGEPWGIAIHPELGFIFWTDSNYADEGFIGRAHLDGSYATKIVKAGAFVSISRPTGLTLDFSEDRIYWVDEELQLMMSAGLNGGDADVQIVLQDDDRISEPRAVGIYKNTVYWTDLNTLVLYKAPLRRDDDETASIVMPDSISKIITGESMPPGDFKVFDGSSSQLGENLCTTDGSSCSCICMASPGPRRTLSCLCPAGFTCRKGDLITVEVDQSIGKCVVVAHQNLTSSSSDAETRARRDEPAAAAAGFLLVTNLKWVMRLNLELMCVEEVALALPLSSSEDYLESPQLDVKHKRLYWVNFGKDIKRLHLNGGGSRDPPEHLVSLSNGSRYSLLAFDWLSQNLYYFDRIRSTIDVIRTEDVVVAGSSAFHGTSMRRRVVLSRPHVRSPTGLAVHPAEGYIFWTEPGSTDHAFIGRAHLDGSHATKIISNFVDEARGKIIIRFPEEITVDYSGDRIYWKDTELHCIMSADLNGGDVSKVLQAHSRSFWLKAAFVVYENRAYWTAGIMQAILTTPIRPDKTVRPMYATMITIGHFTPGELKVYGGRSSHHHHQAEEEEEDEEEHPCTHSNCSYICIASPPAPKRIASCLCPDGFTSQNNNNDTRGDEASTPSNGADLSLTKCVPEPETPPCGVEEEEDAGLLLVVSNRSWVLRIMDSWNQTDRRVAQLLLLPLRGKPTSVDFDLQHNCLYWVDSRGQAIKRLQLLSEGSSSGRDPELLLVSANRSYFGGLAFDWMSRNLYFTHTLTIGFGQIEVLTISTGEAEDGSAAFQGGMMRKILLTRPYVKDPLDIAVHPAKGYIFWTDYAFLNIKNSFMGRAHLDGSHATTIISNKNGSGGYSNKHLTIGSPTGLTVDYIADRIYWMELALGRIMSADLNGDDVKIVLQSDPRISGLESPVSFGVYKKSVYWTDKETGGLYKAPLQQHEHDDNNKSVSPTTKCRITGGGGLIITNSIILKVYGGGGESQQGENLCTNNTNSNNNCSFICMASPPGPQQSASYLCPDGLTSQNDTTCV